MDVEHHHPPSIAMTMASGTTVASPVRRSSTHTTTTTTTTSSSDRDSLSTASTANLTGAAASPNVNDDAPTSAAAVPLSGNHHQLGSVPYYKLFAFADFLDCLLMFFGSAASIVQGGALPIFFIYLGKLIDSLGALTLDPLRAPHEVNKYALYFIYLGLVRFGSGWLEVCLWMYAGDRQAARMRSKYVRALITQDVGFFDTDVSMGEVVMGISSDTALIQDAIGVKTGNVLHYLAQFVTGFAVAFSSLWELTLLTLAVMPVMVAAAAAYGLVMVSLTQRSHRAYVAAGNIAHEAIGQIRTVQAFVGEEAAKAAYVGALKETRRLGVRSGLVKGFGVGVLYGVGFACFSLLLWYAGRLVRSGDSSGGLAFTTILNVVSSCLALGQAAPDVATISKARVSGYTVLRMIRRQPLIARNKDDGVKLEKIKGDIELRGVDFSYPSRPHVQIFGGFSLTIPAGKVAAIVGSSGSGKSTVISLIERFYDPTSGEVLLDGHNIKCMQLHWLREQMALVNQEPSLFATTIAENIRYGKQGGASMDEVIRAAKISCAHDFIDVLPKRYDTQVGERGAQLSGGQKQRIAIARAMLRNPAILLLDEATSALDSESEKSVQDALDKVMLGRTTVVVAHRLSTIQNADMIAFVQDGRVVEVGSHRELLDKGDAYASLVKIQQDAPLRSQQENAMLRRDSRNSRGSFSGSVSQRTFSFRSTADPSVGMGIKMNNELFDVDDLMGPRPSLKRLFVMNASEWPYGLISAVGALAAGAVLPLFGLFLTQALVYFNYPDPDYMKRGLIKVSIMCGALGAMSVVCYTLEFYFSGIAGENITLRIRRLMFSAILRNEISWFDQNNSSVIASRLANDAPLVRTTIVDRMITLLQNVGLTATAFIITFNLQYKIALVMVATLPGLVLANIGQIKFAKGFSGDLSKAYVRANTVAAEAVSNIRTVAAFCAEDKVMSAFSRELQEPQRRLAVRGQIGGIGFGTSQFILFSSYGLSLWYSSHLMKSGDATFGEVMKCFMVMMITAFGVAEALGMAPDFLQGTDELRAVFRIVDRQTEIDSADPKAEEVKAEEVKGAIELKHVDFSYPTRPDAQVFKNLNLRIRRGHSLALVGTSGSGKSTVIALIARFYDPTSGRVLVDGRDVRQLRLKSLRQHIGLVQQEPALFSTSIYDNIRYGRESATEAEIVEAAKAANAHSFVSAMPEGYATEVGERGVQLSGGQKQRIAIARAMLRNPAILLLDEATSALDAESEKLVQEALERLMQKRTTVMVAHRLSTIQNAHSIAVIQSGAVVEQGSHHELLTKQAAYFQLLNLSSAQQHS